MNKIQIWRARRSYHLRDGRSTSQITLHDIGNLVYRGIDFDYKDRSKTNPIPLELVLLSVIKEREITKAYRENKIFTKCIKERKSITEIIRSLENGKC